MTPEHALGGVEFHAKASQGLLGRIRDDLETSGSIEAINTAADNLETAYRNLYREIKRLAVADEMKRLEARRSELEQAA